MGHEFSKENFETWLIEDMRLSERAARDVLSRLKRCQNLISTEDFRSMSAYESALMEVLETSAIPVTSQKSMLRSARLFYEYIS